MIVANASPLPLPAEMGVWHAEKLRLELKSDDPVARHAALAMSVQPGAPVDECLAEIVYCAEFVKGNPAVLQFVPIALGGATPGKMDMATLELISSLLTPNFADPIRIFSAHALFRLKLIPASAFERLSALLVHAEASARQIALLTLTLVIKPAAGAITQMVAVLPPDRWTTEALAALAKSAGDSHENQRVVEQYVMRSLPSAPIVPTGIAGYTALAQMKPSGAAIPVLARIASTATDSEHWKAALASLTTLGELAQGAATELGNALASMDDPEREEAMCRVLVSIRAKEKDVPLARVIQRIESGPERSVAAHCMLLALHAKRFAAIARTVRTRYASASGVLKPTLSQTHVALAGIELSGAPAQRS